MIYVIMGGPATGKGTRSKILSKELGLPHISTGSLLRNEALNNEKLAKSLSKGSLVSDEVVNKALYKRLKEEDCKGGFILDGYPRKIDQVYALEAMMRKLNMEITEVIELVIPRELAFRRVLERRECPKCKRVYGVDFPAKDKIHCDDCGEELFSRSDDTEETLEKRLKVYEKESQPILDYYRKKGLLKTVDSSNSPEKVLQTL